MGLPWRNTAARGPALTGRQGAGGSTWLSKASARARLCGGKSCVLKGGEWRRETGGLRLVGVGGGGGGWALRSCLLSY